MKKHKLVFLLFMLPLPVIAALIALQFQTAGFWADGKPADGSNQGLAKSADGQAITSFTFSPATTTGGNSSTGTISLRHPAQAGGMTVILSNNNASIVRAPKSVAISAGQTSATFTIETSKVAAHTTVGLSATYEGGTQTDQLTVLPPEHAGWYVAPDGSPKGKGTYNSPWDLATALAQGPGGTEVKPGDTIWLRGGRYTGTFISTLTGKENAPITVRALPGERVILDRDAVSESKQPALKIKGAWVWFWGIEIMNSSADRSRKSPYSKEDEPWRGSGADVYAPNVKFINMVFHDNGHGIWDKQDMTEVHGCLFFYNGNNKREHGLYIGNANGTKYITDNILFAQGGYGILAHSDSPSSSQKGLHLEGNVSFNNGLLTLDDQTTGNIQVGGVRGVAAERIVLKNNYIYNSPGNAVSKSNGIRLGYEDKSNRDAKLLDNYIVSRAPVRLWWWQSVEFLGNTIYSQGESFELELPSGVSASGYRWNFNTYFSGRQSGPAFVGDSRTYSFSRWQQATGLDGNSQVMQTATLRPDGVKVFVRPNRYEAGRANIIVYNWDLREQITVDVSAVVPVGASYEVRDAENYFGEPVASGTYNGAPLSLPMKLKQVAQPVGNVERVPSHTAPEFAVFVLRQISDPPARANQKSAR